MPAFQVVDNVSISIAGLANYLLKPVLTQVSSSEIERIFSQASAASRGFNRCRRTRGEIERIFFRPSDSAAVHGLEAADLSFQ